LLKFVHVPGRREATVHCHRPQTHSRFDFQARAWSGGTSPRLVAFHNGTAVCQEFPVLKAASICVLGQSLLLASALAGNGPTTDDSSDHPDPRSFNERFYFEDHPGEASPDRSRSNDRDNGTDGARKTLKDLLPPPAAAEPPPQPRESKEDLPQNTPVTDAWSSPGRIECRAPRAEELRRYYGQAHREWPSRLLRASWTNRERQDLQPGWAHRGAPHTAPGDPGEGGQHAKRAFGDVRIDDRAPTKMRFVIDLSRGSARALGISRRAGTASVALYHAD
jgi:hypothetical protein